MIPLRLTMCLALFLGAGNLALTDSADNKNQENPTPTTQPAGEEKNQSVTPPPMPSAEDIIKSFEEQRPANTPIAPTQRPDDRSSTSGQRMDGPTTRYPDGFMLVDRAGRVVKDGDWWVFSFQTSNVDTEGALRDKPMKLLLNRMLERLLFEAQGSEVNPVFIVTGEVTEFKGENYLLLRKILRQRTDENLSE